MYSDKDLPTLAAPSTNVQTNWYPFTLRWYFLLLPIVLSLAFGISVICLHLYSRSHHGLGRDDGSFMVLFAWRFLPTLIAVLYTQITVIIFEDVKRTEPFARLASSPASGTSAYGTLLQSPKSWWGILYDMTFKRKKMGKTGWSLVFALFVHILALLAISPLSSALLATEEVFVPQTVDFTRSTPTGNSQVSMNGTRETYMRIMANMTRNMSNSAWTSDESFTLPFWPSSGQRQMQSKILTDDRSWEAQTTTFSTGYSCENMTLESADLRNRTYKVADWHSTEDWQKYNGTTPMVTYVLSSASGCRYELSGKLSILEFECHANMLSTYSESCNRLVIYWWSTLVRCNHIPSNRRRLQNGWSLCGIRFRRRSPVVTP